MRAVPRFLRSPTSMRLRRFYRLRADATAVSRWHLKAPVDSSGREVDPRAFTQGALVPCQPPLELPVRRAGDRVDFNLCDFDMVLPAAANIALQALVGPAIQRFPVTVEGQQQFEILNVCNLVQCIDESQSSFTKWTDSDGRPEKVGQFRMIVHLKIDPVAAKRCDIFRVAGWHMALIVSDKVRQLFESANVSGIEYERVA